MSYPPPPPGDKIGWQWVTFGNSGVLAPNEVAGLPGYAQANWNPEGGIGQHTSGGLTNLVDNLGNTTTLDLAWTTEGNGGWIMSSALADPDQKLNNNFLNVHATLNISEIPDHFGEDGYSVIVYYNNSDPTSISDITLAGIFDDLVIKRIITGGTAQTRYDEHGYLLEEGLLDGPTNVIIFEGLNDLGFTLSFDTVSGNGNNGIAGFQIVKNATVVVPEPATMLLMSLASCGFAMIRRRRA